jgi:hypothetical protein
MPPQDESPCGVCGGEGNPAQWMPIDELADALARGVSVCLASSAEREKPVIEDRMAVCCDVHRIERDMRRWWTQARLVSGWDQAAWAPNNTCPVCDERRSLRIHAHDKAAFCTSCRETWGPGSIGILAEHVRAENGDEIAS